MRKYKYNPVVFKKEKKTRCVGEFIGKLWRLKCFFFPSAKYKRLDRRREGIRDGDGPWRLSREGNNNSG